MMGVGPGHTPTRRLRRRSGEKKEMGQIFIKLLEYKLKIIKLKTF